jgi:DNA invertase Pin-like site-specific DNA recombinase
MNWMYLRVSSDKQNTDQQKLSILEYARKNDLKIDDEICITISSKRSPKERRVDELLAKLQTGDQLIVSELSRLGRSVGEVIQVCNTLAKNGVNLTSIKEGLEIRIHNGKCDLQSKIMVTLLSLFSEIERDLLSERVRCGLQSRKANGLPLGRKRGSLGTSKLTGKEEQIQSLLNARVSKTSISRLCETSRTNLVHFIHSRGLKSQIRPEPQHLVQKRASGVCNI